MGASTRAVPTVAPLPAGCVRPVSMTFRAGARDPVTCPRQSGVGLERRSARACAQPASTTSASAPATLPSRWCSPPMCSVGAVANPTSALRCKGCNWGRCSADGSVTVSHPARTGDRVEHRRPSAGGCTGRAVVPSWPCVGGSTPNAMASTSGCAKGHTDRIDLSPDLVGESHLRAADEGQVHIALGTWVSVRQREVQRAWDPVRSAPRGHRTGGPPGRSRRSHGGNRCGRALSAARTLSAIRTSWVLRSPGVTGRPR